MQVNSFSSGSRSARPVSILVPAVLIAVGALFLGLFVYLFNSTNPSTPAGCVGYVTQGAWLGQQQFLGTQTGPTSYGRTWLGHVTNVAVTPYLSTEDFDDNHAVLAKDSVKVRFAVHAIFKVKPDPAMIRDFVEHYAAPGAVDPVSSAYASFIREPMRTSARNELQLFEALQIKDNIVAIGNKVETDIKKLCAGTPFDVVQIVVGNIQYPESVANAVANKMAAIQQLEQVQTDAKRRIAEAEGIATAMNLVQTKLTPLYLQHEAIEAQKLMVGSPNHTTIYIPVGNMGVPIVTPVGPFESQEPKLVERR